MIAFSGGDNILDARVARAIEVSSLFTDKLNDAQFRAGSCICHQRLLLPDGKRNRMFTAQKRIIDGKNAGFHIHRTTYGRS